MIENDAIMSAGPSFRGNLLKRSSLILALTHFSVYVAYPQGEDIKVNERALDANREVIESMHIDPADRRRNINRRIKRASD